eukprot:TRINITY_DN3991_c0_g1_i1.p1 TRINITY_DN3991_c0_g1~~TRINITY_DN3991_c0_g1_i1.p1  ORF type:complete len:644 (+),score=140.30 TRINITY_DN3991_c0_g1_i1:3-1934(+)
MSDLAPGLTVAIVAAIVLAYTLVAMVQLYRYRLSRPFNVLGWQLLMSAMCSAVLQGFSGILFGAFHGNYNASVCKFWIVVNCLTPPLFIGSLLLAGHRLLKQSKLELLKVTAASNTAAETEEGNVASTKAALMAARIARARAALLPSYSLSRLAIMLVPAAVVPIYEAAQDNWTSLDGNTVNCHVDHQNLFVAAFVLFCAFALVYLTVKLQRQHDNFGIRKMFKRLMFYGVPLIILWVYFLAQQFVWSSLPINILFACWVSHWIMSPVITVYDATPLAAPLVTQESSIFAPLLRLRDLVLSSNTATFTLTTTTATPRPATMVLSPVDPSSLAAPPRMPPPRLAEFIQTEKGLRAFTAFLTREFAAENIYFYRAVDAFRVHPTEAEAISLVRKYILDSAPLQVNINVAARRPIMEVYHLLVPFEAPGGAPGAKAKEGTPKTKVQKKTDHLHPTHHHHPNPNPRGDRSASVSSTAGVHVVVGTPGTAGSLAGHSSLAVVNPILSLGDSPYTTRRQMRDIESPPSSRKNSIATDAPPSDSPGTLPTPSPIVVTPAPEAPQPPPPPPPPPMATPEPEYPVVGIPPEILTSMFDLAQQQVFGLLESDSYRRFLAKLARAEENQSRRSSRRSAKGSNSAGRQRPPQPPA